MRCISLPTRAARAYPIARQGGGTAFARAAARSAVGRREAARDQGDELARDFDFRSTRNVDLATRPNDRKRIVFAVEGNAVADQIGRDHVELLALELAAGVVLDIVGLRGKPDDER